MKNKIWQHISSPNRTFMYILLLAIALVFGIVQTAATYDSALGMGDNSTFYAFTRNVVNGEAMYDDFIHFRTPGTIALFSVIMGIFGQAQSTIEIATRTETLILFPLLFLVAAMILFRKRNPWYVVLAYALLAFMPGVAQLRAGFGLLAIAIYLYSFDVTTKRHRWLMLSGGLASVTFIFGQEIALMVGLCILAGELLNRFKKKELLSRIKYLAIGATVGLLPLLLYLLVYSNIGNFIYYTTYYSFILQPKYMDLPFPAFDISNLIYYLPFVIYWLCFLVLYANKKLDFKSGLLLSFGILRLITALGRSDFGHLLFSIPELFLIAPYFLAQAKTAQFNREVIKKFIPYGVILAAIFIIAILGPTVVLALVPFLILFALRQRTFPTLSVKSNMAGNFRVYLLLGVAFIGFIYLLAPTYISVLKGLKSELIVNDSNSLRVGGVKTDEVNFNQINAVKKSVEQLHPQTVFAFPIQPFYYSLADHHASRFLTFEPQTTVQEQEQTIEDLKRTRPEVIIFDPLQAQGLSGSLWKVSDYILANYELKTEVAMRETLWVMVPKQMPSRDDKLAFRVFKNEESKLKAIPIQNTVAGQQSAIEQKPGTISFDFEGGGASMLRLSVQALPERAQCGEISVRHSAVEATSRITVCNNQGEVAIPLDSSASRIHIELINNEPMPILWNNPRVQ